MLYKPVYLYIIIYIYYIPVYIYIYQCCGAETIFFPSGSGSDFQKVSAPAPAPAPAPATALELPDITDFMLKRTFFMFLMEENRPNSHARSYSI
jgi:hypothetical protein